MARVLVLQPVFTGNLQTLEYNQLLAMFRSDPDPDLKVALSDEFVRRRIVELDAVERCVNHDRWHSRYSAFHWLTVWTRLVRSTSHTKRGGSA